MGWPKRMPLMEFGQLTYEMWRVGLIIDRPGIHAKR